MNFNRYANLVEATNDLLKRGFTESYRFENDKMICLASEKSYLPDDLKILEIHRFEGMSNPSDNSVLFAVECIDGTKGTIISAYGADSNEAMDEFIKKVEVVPNKKDINFEARTKYSSRK